MKIVADAHIPCLENFFSQAGELYLKPGREITAADVRDADMLLVRSITQVNAALLHDTKVKFVGSVTAGADHIDTAWLNQAGIQWAVARGFNAPPVADYVVSVVAALQRQQKLSAYRARVAVIGVGNVGRLVADKLQLLGYEVMLCDPWRGELEKQFPHQPLDTIADVDLISLHVPLVQDGKYPTYHFIDSAFLARQKPNCVLLNAGRGAVIDTAALKTHGDHLQWCFDVWEREPHIDNEVLARTVIGTPHIAGYSAQSKLRGVEMIYDAACDLGVMQRSPKPLLMMPRQTLAFAGTEHHWQDVVLGIFNPTIMSTIMRTLLLPIERHGALFDDMRNQFTYRHELAYTDVKCNQLLEPDRVILERLGVCVKTD